ncbi:hypothetical protein F5H01DRAFT_46204, partial [Linnemannia elongata]
SSRTRCPPFPAAFFTALLAAFLQSFHLHLGDFRSNHGLLEDMQTRKRCNNLVRTEGIELRRSMFDIETGWISPSTLRQPRQPRPRRSDDFIVLAIAVALVMVVVAVGGAVSTR